jgi:hypothetical protein
MLTQKEIERGDDRFSLLPMGKTEEAAPITPELPAPVMEALPAPRKRRGRTAVSGRNR